VSRRRNQRAAAAREQADRMTARRQALTLLSLLGLVPQLAFAQTRRVWRIGLLSSGSAGSRTASEFMRGMRELDYVEGTNLVVERRFGAGDYEQLPEWAAELVQLKVDIIVAWASPAIRAAQKATKTIPIVFPTTGDPVGAGFAASLSRPGGNITGVSNSNLDVSTKLVELLLVVKPKLSQVAVLTNPASSTQPTMLRSIEAACQKVGLQVLRINASTPDDLVRGFADMVRNRAGGVIIADDAFMVVQRDHIAALALKYQLPSITQNIAYTEAGGLMTYGTDVVEGFRRAAVYVDKILKGAKPAELPIEQPTRFELIVNSKTAKALGLTISKELLLRADKVVE